MLVVTSAVAVVAGPSAFGPAVGLQRRGYIELTDGSIVIRDEKSLQERADQ